MVRKTVSTGILGLLSLLALTASVAQGQTTPPNAKITADAGWNLCLDFQARDLALTVAVDGGASLPAAGAVWEGTAAPYSVKIPLSQMSPAARTIGVHSAVVTAPDVVETMADGSTLTIPGGSITVPYQVISTTGPAPSNPRWLRILGTLSAVIFGYICIVFFLV